MTKTDLAILTGDIDAAAATIKNVSVITAGEARGHGMQIDEKTDHYSGFNEIVGALKNFTIDGDQLRADLFLLKNHDATARIIEMAELMPDTFGLSISFSGEHEENGDTTFARCSEIYSADLVDTPAANPTGLFSAKVDSMKTVMDEKQIADAIAAALAPVIEEMAALSAKLSDMQPTEEKEMAVEVEISEDDSASESKDEEMKKAMAAELAELKALVSNFGAKPVAPAVAAEVKADAKVPTNFNEALDLIKAEGLSGTAATKSVIARYPDLYLAARNSGIRTL